MTFAVNDSDFLLVLAVLVGLVALIGLALVLSSEPPRNLPPSGFDL